MDKGQIDTQMMGVRVSAVWQIVSSEGMNLYVTVCQDFPEAATKTVS